MSHYLDLSRISYEEILRLLRPSFIATVSDYRNVRRDEPAFQACSLDSAWIMARAKYKGTTDFLVNIHPAPHTLSPEDRTRLTAELRSRDRAMANLEKAVLL